MYDKDARLTPAVLLALGAFLIADSAPAYAARVGSFLYFWFDPQVIYNDAKSMTTLRIYPRVAARMTNSVFCRRLVLLSLRSVS